MKFTHITLVLAAIALGASSASAQITGSKTVTGPNGKTASRFISRYRGGSATTATGPNGNTANRIVARGEGQANATLTGPNGQSSSCVTTHYPSGNATTITGPNDNTANRTITGRGSGTVDVSNSGPHHSGGRTRTR